MTNEAKIIKWLDKQVKWQLQDSRYKVNKKITLKNLSACCYKEVHLDDVSFDYIVNILGFTSNTEPWNCNGSGYTHQKYFVYKDVRFFCLCE